MPEEGKKKNLFFSQHLNCTTPLELKFFFFCFFIKNCCFILNTFSVSFYHKIFLTNSLFFLSVSGQVVGVFPRLARCLHLQYIRWVFYENNHLIIIIIKINVHLENKIFQDLFQFFLINIFSFIHHDVTPQFFFVLNIDNNYYIYYDQYLKFSLLNIFNFPIN